MNVLERNHFFLGWRCICSLVAFLCYFLYSLFILCLKFSPKVVVQGDGHFAPSVSLIQSLGRGHMHNPLPKQRMHVFAG